MRKVLLSISSVAVLSLVCPCVDAAAAASSSEGPSKSATVIHSRIDDVDARLTNLEAALSEAQASEDEQKEEQAPAAAAEAPAAVKEYRTNKAKVSFYAEPSTASKVVATGILKNSLVKETGEAGFGKFVHVQLFHDTGAKKGQKHKAKGFVPTSDVNAVEAPAAAAAAEAPAAGAVRNYVTTAEKLTVRKAGKVDPKNVVTYLVKGTAVVTTGKDKQGDWEEINTVKQGKDGKPVASGYVHAAHLKAKAKN